MISCLVKRFSSALEKMISWTLRFIVFSLLM